MSLQADLPIMQSPVAAVWTHLLSGMFSSLGRMQRLANCWEDSVGRYCDNALAESLGAEETDSAIRLLHYLIWSDWVKGSVETYEIDLILYLKNACDGAAYLLVEWTHTESFLTFVPDSATEDERRLFATNMRGALERLRTLRLDESRSNFEKLQQNRHVQQIRDLIEREYADPDLSLKKLSKRVRLSERHLSRLFKSLTGKNVRHYLRDVRMAQAVTLLANADCDIKFVAAATGYKDCSHFGRDFRKWRGCTPGEFRGRKPIDNLLDSL